jgi:hypothetical protein
MVYSYFDSTTGKINTTKYNTKIVNERNTLDIKLKKLYNNRDGTMNNQKKHINSTIYENILLTILATSLVYFIFING